jgi:CheY-like chemotaxis protein
MTKLLVVEDDAMNRDMLRRRLLLEGYDVVTATDGLQAVALVGTEQPDLVLMDMGLPHLDGWEATQQLKANPMTAATPVIALTAYTFVEDYQKSVDAGCDDYETKPVDFARLLQKIRSLLGRESVQPSDRIG